MPRTPNYDKTPTIAISGTAQQGWSAIGSHIRSLVSSTCRVVTVECYPGVLEEDVLVPFQKELQPAVTLRSADAWRTKEQVNALVEPHLGADPVFGRMNNLVFDDFLDPRRLAELQSVIERTAGTVLIYGPGASRIHPGDLLVYADLSRWEIQLRQRRGLVDSLGSVDRGTGAARQYKRGFFVDWRVADRHKRTLWDRIDFFLDTHVRDDPRLATGQVIRTGLNQVGNRPFRVVPFFDPAPWGGQWMKNVCGLDPAKANYGWCFDCVPEENSLRLDIGGVILELPAIDLVFQEPQRLLGNPVHQRFGAEFPIRFDLLDTIGGGNLSLQVHPLTEYIRDQFGMEYTQDESYYLLDAEPGAHVYLGVKSGVEGPALFAELAAAQGGTQEFDAPRFANCWPAKKHDHFLIPAGTIHCSGAGAMVLEISATPYIFTFKLWDWARLGLDGKPRPIHLDHGSHVLKVDRDTAWTERNLINRLEPLAAGPGWKAERTGLHDLQFIETVRHWFSVAVSHDTGGVERGSVHVLNLVEGEDAVVSSPTAAFAPFTVHYAETFIVPAAVGRYEIAPGPVAHSRQQTCATIRAHVR